MTNQQADMISDLYIEQVRSNTRSKWGQPTQDVSIVCNPLYTQSEFYDIVKWYGRIKDIKKKYADTYIVTFFTFTEAVNCVTRLNHVNSKDRFICTLL